MKMKMQFAASLVIGLFCYSVGSANATLVNSLPGGTTIPIPSMNYYGGDPQFFGPGIVWSSTNMYSQGGSLFGNTALISFGANGDWQGFSMAGLNDDYDTFFVSDTMTFKFSSPVMGVGGFLNYTPGSINPVISVYNSDYELIESAELNFSTGGGLNTGMFLGFLEQSNQIKYFTLTDANIGITGLTVAGSAPVPEPATIFLMGAGVAGLMAKRRKRKV